MYPIFDLLKVSKRKFDKKEFIGVVSIYLHTVDGLALKSTIVIMVLENIQAYIVDLDLDKIDS